MIAEQSKHHSSCIGSYNSAARLRGEGGTHPLTLASLNIENCMGTRSTEGEKECLSGSEATMASSASQSRIFSASPARLFDRGAKIPSCRHYWPIVMPARRLNPYESGYGSCVHRLDV